MHYVLDILFTLKILPLFIYRLKPLLHKANNIDLSLILKSLLFLTLNNHSNVQTLIQDQTKIKKVCKTVVT
eukprot:UN01324